MKENVHENQFVKFWIENGVLYGEFKVSKIDLDAAKESVSARVTAVSGTAYPALIDARSVQSISKEARDYFASKEGTHLITASALLIDSSVGKFLGNFFLQISKPKIPTRIFTNMPDALKWLKNYNSPQ